MSRASEIIKAMQERDLQEANKDISIPAKLASDFNSLLSLDLNYIEDRDYKQIEDRRNKAVIFQINNSKILGEKEVKDFLKKLK